MSDTREVEPTQAEILATSLYGYDVADPEQWPIVVGLLDVALAAAKAEGMRAGHARAVANKCLPGDCICGLDAQRKEAGL